MENQTNPGDYQGQARKTDAQVQTKGVWIAVAFGFCIGVVLSCLVGIFLSDHLAGLWNGMKTGLGIGIGGVIGLGILNFIVATGDRLASRKL